MKRFWALFAMLLLLSGLIGPAVSAQGPEAQPPRPSGPAATGTAPEGLPPAVEAGPTAVWPGPDGFGYLGQTTPFSYVDIHTTGTLISGLTDDSYAGPFSIGFTFNFYGVGKTQFYVSSNGHIEFDAGSSSLYAYCPYPNSSNPANHVALMFDDLYPNYSTGGVYYQTFASCPYPGYAAQQCLVVQYYNWNHYGGGTAGDFEVILTSGGDMIFQYNDGGAENCSNSVEGIQGNNVPGDHGLQYACRQANSCPDGTAFKIGLPTGVIVTPEFSHQEDCSGVTVQHAFTVRNYTGQPDTFNITCSGYTWPTTCPATVGPIPQGGSAPLNVQVTIPNNVCPGETDLVDILVQAQSSPYSATVAAETQLSPVTQPTWELRATSPNSSMDDVVYYWDAGVGPRVYRIGGYGANGTVNIYNPATNAWTTGATEPSPAIAYTVDGCLGLNASGQDIIAIFNDATSGATTWHVYNIDTDSWTTPPVPSGFPSNGLWATDVAAGLHYGVNLCYISGGATTPGGGNTNTLYRYDPAAHTVTNLGNFTYHPAGFDFHSSWYIPPGVLPGLPNGGVCVAGGVDSSSVVFADTQCYDFVNGFNSPNADLGTLPVAHWGGADFELDPPGPDFQLWIVNGVDASMQLWPHAMYYSALDGQWHMAPDPAAAVYRVEGDAFGMDAYVVNGSTGGFTYSNINQHQKQPCPFNMGIINGYVMDAQTGCSQATCTPAAVHLEPAGIDIPADSSGYYTATVPACTYEATASAPGYQPDGPYTVPVTTTAPVQQDFCLNRPDIEVNPTAFDVIGYYSTPITLPLEISNAGQVPLTWQILEIPASQAAQGEDLVVRPAYFGVDDYIAEEFAASADGKADIFLVFAGEVDLSPATRIKDWEARGRWVVDTLQALADRSQANVRKWLEAQGIEYTVNLNNTIFVRLTQEQFEAALRFPEVVGAFGNRSYPLEPIIADANAPVPNATVDWGLLKVRAPETWADYNARGQGIVVANIDTGVQWDHPALDQAYLCPNNPTDPRCWYDPTGNCGGQVCDNNGHGTHTMGTMVGDDDPSLTYIVGMAPDAQWIACKGCATTSCYQSDLTACANWVLQPGGNPANRPHIVNNSWGGPGCNTWYQSYVQAWRAAGIFPAFSIGNSGPSCNTRGSPGDYPESFASGATDSNDAIASFSSRGPSCWGEIKPEVSAPGVDICSSVPTNGWNCTADGTSMASPHTAGLAAMLWSCNPDLVGNIAATEYIITSTAVCIQDLSCGGTACPDGANNIYGWGRIDAYAAAQAGCIQDIPWVWESPITGTTDPGGTSLVDVTFHCPVSNVVDLTGTLRIVNNDPCENPVDIPLVLHCRGQPTLPDIEVTPTALSAEQCPDTVTTQTLTICNVGGTPLEWSLWELTQTVQLAGWKPLERPTVYLPEAVADVATPNEPAGASVPFSGATWSYPQAVLWDNGPLVTHPGACSGQDASRLQTSLGMTTLGFGHQFAYGYRMSDQFTITNPLGWNIDTITFFAYQTGAPMSPSPITGVYLQIWDGPPWAGGSVVWGDLTTNRLLSSTFTNIQRDSETSPCANTRYIFADVAQVGTWLPPGTYWLDWTTDGNPSYSGPWAPPITILGQTTTGDAYQYTTAWAPALDNGTLTQQGMPFIIEGSVVQPPVDVPWLSEEPTSGTVPGGQCQDVTVTFDSTGMAPGTYTAGLLITSNDPDEPEITIPVTMTVLEPLHDVDFTWTPPTPVAGEVVTFQATALGSGPITYDWDFGDGNYGSGNPATHTYAAPGDYLVTLTATNPCGVLVIQYTVTVASPLAPDIEVSPLELFSEQCPDTVTTQTLSICNVGDAPLVWSISELSETLALGETARPMPPVRPPITLPAGAPQSLNEYIAAGRPAFTVKPAAPTPSVAVPETLTFYTSRADFDADFPGLPVEGYENGSMAPGTVDAVPHPLDEFSSNAYFDPGDILPGIQFWATAAHNADEIAVLGEQFLGNLSKTAVANYFSDGYRIVFNPPVQAVGLDLQDFLGSYSCQIDIYDTNGYLTSVTSACNEAGVFWGVASDADPIAELVITDLGGGAEGADNIAFGNVLAYDVPWLSEEPITGTVNPGMCQVVQVTFDSTGMAPGTYTAGLLIQSNDPDEPEITIPVTLTVLAPVSDADFTWAPLEPIAGEVVHFTGTVASGTPPFTYEWDFGDGGSGSGPNPTHVYAAPGDYTVVMTVSNACGQVTATYTIHVVEGCVPPAGADFTWAPLEPIMGEVVHFTGTVASGTPPFTYEWDFGDGGSGSGPNPTHVYAAPGDYIVVLTVTNDCGQDTATYIIHVVEGCVPPAGADFSWAPLEPLAGEEVVFTGTVASGTPPFTYEWDFGDGGSGSGPNPTHVYAAPGDYTVVMTVSNACGQDTATYIIHVVEGCVPPAGVDFTWAPTSPFAGETAYFTATVASGTPPFTYEWDFGDGGSGSGPNPTHVYAAAGDYTVVLTVTNACGQATATHSIVVQPVVPTYYYVYLPLVLKGYTFP